MLSPLNVEFGYLCGTDAVNRHTVNRITISSSRQPRIQFSLLPFSNLINAYIKDIKRGICNVIQSGASP